MVKNVRFKMNTFQKKTRNVRCQIFKMSDFCMAYPEMNGGVLRYYIYNIYIYILYIINIIYNIFLFYPSPIEEWLIENLTFLNLTILHIASG